MSGALFGNSSASGRSSSKHLVEFRAGKMQLKGTTVTPDKRKGLLYIYQADDSLIHFCWKDRTSGLVEDDLIIFPDDCEFKRVKQCTTGRVYLLKFKSNARKFFFWLQEPKTEKDEENCKKVNETLNNPPAPGSSSSGRGGLPAELASLGAGLGEGGLQSMLGNVDQQQLMQLLGSSGMSGLGGLGGLAGLSALTQQTPASQTPKPATTTAAATRAATTTPSATTPAPSSTTTTTPAPSSNPTPAPATPAAAASGSSIQLSDLQSILQNMNIPGSQPAQARVDLAKVLTSDVMAPVLANPEFQQQLLQHAPEGENLPRDPERLRETVTSPQFQQAMNMFTAAFQSGQLGPLIGQFNLGAAATEAANKGDLEAFSKALQASEGKEGDAAKKDDDKSQKKDDKPDDDDSMQVD